MVAGAAGIDAVLLAIATDEGVKPQTREHLAICSFLDIRHGIVALTKSDLVEPDLLEVVSLETRELLDGSFLGQAPIVPVSARSGAGLPALRAALERLFEVIPERPAGGVPRLPIDRSFVMRGFGTVVTGTLVSGSVHEGDLVQILPGNRSARVRGLQVHGSRVSEARAGQRTAINLQGVSREEAPRGSTVSAPQGLPVTRRARARLRLLAGAPKSLRRTGRVRFHQGTWEGHARIRVLEEQADGWLDAEILLGSAAVLLPNDRFVLRLPSPVGTVGGGTVLDVRPPAARSRRRATVGAGESRESALLERVARRGLAGRRPGDVATELGLSSEELDRALVSLEANRGIVKAGGLLFERGAWAELEASVVRDLEAFHRDEPLLPGAKREEMRGRLSREMPLEAWRALLEGLEARELLRLRGERVALPGHRVVLSRSDREVAERIEERFREAALDPPDPQEVLATEHVANAIRIVEWLVAEERLVRIRDGRLFHTEPLQELRAKLRDYAEHSSTIDVATFKQLAGVTRKNAIPLLEQMDAERRTRRIGNVREILTA
jgi:selenocysteine-specific elongation factor